MTDANHNNGKTEELRDLFQDVTGTDEVVEEQENMERRVSEDEEVDTDKALPTIEADCEECDNNVAYYYLQQTRAADESETRFYICTECENKWRDYD
jgi:DNA-directed RNA polymerase subunit M